MEEIWKPIPGHEQFYEVSNFGRVRNILTSRICLGGIAKGYRRITLNLSGKRSFNVHFLVMLAFVGPCPEGHEINHKDFNKSNNHIDNLEYVTHLQNLQHYWNHSENPRRTSRGRHGRITETDKKHMIRLRKEGWTQKEIGQEFGLSQCYVSSLLRSM